MFWIFYAFEVKNVPISAVVFLIYQVNYYNPYIFGKKVEHATEGLTTVSVRRESMQLVISETRAMLTLLHKLIEDGIFAVASGLDILYVNKLEKKCLIGNFKCWNSKNSHVWRRSGSERLVEAFFAGFWIFEKSVF